MTIEMSLEEGVAEVLGLLTGQDLQYDPDQDRFQTIARTINRAVRTTALEKEWSFYSDVATLGYAVAGERKITLPSSMRVRQVGDDAVRLVDEDGRAIRWAYFLPRDALHKYVGRQGLWCAVTRREITFTRRFDESEDGLEIEAPIMREPEMHLLPPTPADQSEPQEPIDADTLAQPIDFPYPDLIILRAAFLYAQTDPVMQPRVQTIEAQYKDLMYQVIERDDRNTDSPFLNDFVLDIENGVPGQHLHHHHPHSNHGQL